MKQVSVILINYNGHKDTFECIKSIKKSKYENFHIVIVDNASMDENYKALRKQVINDKSITLIRSDDNLGFAGGNNLGIKYSLEALKSDYVFLLNNDTLIESNTIDELVKIAEKHESVGIVAGKIYYYPEKNKIWYAGGEINWNKFTTIHYGQGNIDNGEYDDIKDVEFITGCAMLIKKEVIENVGFLPEEYFMYYEDTDYSVEVKDKGYSLYYNPKAVIYHKISASSGGEESSFSIEYCTRNRRYFMKKFKNKVSFIKYSYSVMFFYLTRVIKIILYILKGEKEKRKALIKGLL